MQATGTVFSLGDRDTLFQQGVSNRRVFRREAPPPLSLSSFWCLEPSAAFFPPPTAAGEIAHGAGISGGRVDGPIYLAP